MGRHQVFITSHVISVYVSYKQYEPTEQDADDESYYDSEDDSAGNLIHS